MHPQKEWWRERRLAPATFMGFPDVTKAELRGYNLYTEQMDAATLAVIIDKCVEEKILNEEFWAKFSWRTQQLINKVNETEICYLFRGFSRRDWIDSHLLLSLWGRSDFLLPRISLEDASVLLEGYSNDHFFNRKYEARVLDHVEGLVTVRNDWTVGELVKISSVLGYSSRLSRQDQALTETRKRILSIVLSKVAEKPGDLFDVPGVTIAKTLASMSRLGVSDLPLLLCLTDELKDSGKLTNKQEENGFNSAVIALKALTELNAIDVFPDLLIEYYDNIYRLSHEALVDMVGIAERLVSPLLPPDNLSVLLLRVSREIYKMEKSVVVQLLIELLTTNSVSEMHAECVGECVDRLVETGVDGVPILDVLRESINRAPKSLQSENLKKLGQVVELVL
jgi:hypothetical protein